jgi:hypothetical protein
MIKYEKLSNNIILDINVISKYKNHKLIINFDHKYFDMASLINIINNYCKNNIDKKNLVICKEIYFSDLLGFNILFNYLKFNKINKKIIQFIIKKSEINDIKKNSNEYISNIDIVISKIINIYQLYYNSNNANIYISKKNNKLQDYLGNSVTLHNVDINKNNIIDMAQNIRKSYNNPKYNFGKPIDIYIVSWFPMNNENNIQENGSYASNNMPINFIVFICILNNNYLIKIIYNESDNNNIININ